jgi:hypothetical protein
MRRLAVLTGTSVTAVVAGGLAACGGGVAGALPDLPVGDDGRGTADFVDDLVSLDRGRPGSLLGPQGSALIVSALAGDTTSAHPAVAGAPLACGVISPEALSSLTPSPTPTPSPTAAVSTDAHPDGHRDQDRHPTPARTPAPTSTPVPPTPTPTPIGVPLPSRPSCGHPAGPGAPAPAG